MSEADRAKWDRKYAVDAYLMGEGPKQILRIAQAHLPPAGRALDVACGEGQTAVWLASRGFEVTGIDVSTVGLAKARRLAAREGVAGRATFLHHDMDQGLPVAGPFDVITCIHFHAPALMPRLREVLSPGGLLVVEVLSRRAIELQVFHPGERFLVATDAVLRFAEGMKVVHHEEIDTPRPVARLVALKAQPS